MPIKAAIVGCGLVAIDQHVPAIQHWSNRIQIVAAIDVQLEKAEHLGKIFNAPSFSSLDEALNYNQTLLEKNRFDTVIMLLPHHLHKEYALKILNTGQYHLLLEKPIAMNLEEAKALIEAGQKTQKVFLVAENAPHWPEVVKMAELIQSQAIGKLVAVKGYLNYPPTDEIKPESVAHNWRLQLNLAGGGVISDGGLHWIRAICELMGEEVTSVFAYTAKTLSHMEGESFGHAILKFQSGKIAMFTMAKVCEHIGEYNTFEAIGTQGHILLKTGPKGSIGYYHERDTKLMMYNKANPNGIEVMKPQGYSQSFVSEYDNFLDAIEHRKPLKVTPESTANDLCIALAIYRSAELKQEVVVPKYFTNSIYLNNATLYPQAASMQKQSHDNNREVIRAKL